MSDTKLLKFFEEIDSADIIECQKINGRRELTQEKMEYFKSLNTKAKEILEDERRGERINRLAEFLYLSTESVANLLKFPIPRYYTYSDVKIIDWFIGKKRNSYLHYKRKITLGIFYLLKDFLEFEGRTLGGIEKYYQLEKENIDIKKRIEKLSEVFQNVGKLHKLIFNEEFPDNHTEHKNFNFVEYAEEDSKLNALLHFTCFPRTNYHDEFAFLRTIHIAEFCFLGIINTVKECIDNIQIEKYSQAKKCLEEATLIAIILHGVFKVLRTMPSKPNNFTNFRDETGNASAVQSKNFQELDVFLRGIDPKKKAVYGENKHLQYLEKYAHVQFTYNLKSVLSTLNESEHKEIIDQAKKFDRKFITWKGLHLGFAKIYLPPDAMGTGMTAGVSYLEKFFTSSIFDDTVIDYDLFSQNFSIDEYPDLHELIKQVDPRIGVAISNKQE